MRAFIRLFSRVNTKVFLQSSCLPEWALTPWALMWLFPSVGENVSRQIGLWDRPKITFLAFIWLLLRVSCNVIFQILNRGGWIIQLVHIYGIWLLWMIMCFFKLPASQKDLPHSAQLCGFSPVWVCMWLFKRPALTNTFLHWAQVCCTFDPFRVSIFCFTFSVS